nr:CAP domain-containing protein [Anaerolineae bacterium]
MINLFIKMTYIGIVFVLMSGIFAPTNAQTSADEYRLGLVTAVNRARQDNGIPTLTMNDSLTSVAMVSIETIAMTNNNNAISRESVRQLLDTRNYHYGHLWYVTHYNLTPAEAVADWVSRYPGEILSGVYTEIGTGYAENPSGDSYLMLLLARQGGSALLTDMPPACENPIAPYPIKGQDLIPPQLPERVAQIRVLTDLYDSLVQGWLNDALVPGTV